MYVGKGEIKALIVKCAHVSNGCDWKGAISSVRDHLASCKCMPVPCPNCKELKPRAKVDEHVSKDCPWTVLSCKFASIGCEVKKAKKNMAPHEGNDPFHLQMALNAIVELKAAQSQPMTVENGASTTFAMSGYGKIMATGDVFTMSPFYVSRYHMSVKVYSSGHSVEHLSIRALILKGMHDAS